MDLKRHIQITLKEIEAYHSQGLFDEAKDRCQEIAGLIRQSRQVKNKESFLYKAS